MGWTDGEDAIGLGSWQSRQSAERGKREQGWPGFRGFMNKLAVLPDCFEESRLDG